MASVILEGEPLAQRIRAEVRGAVAALHSPPRLVSLLAGDDPGALYYAESQRKACADVGINYELWRHDRDCSQQALTEAVQRANADPQVTGCILLMPLPQGAEPRALQRTIEPDKDVEGVHPANIGRLFYGDFSLAPCTAHAVVELLDFAGVDLAGRETVVVGHSEIVGKPAAVMLLRSRTSAPTVTCCHVATRDLAAHTRRAEVLVVACGRPGLVSGDMVRQGAVVIDVGINRVETQVGGERKVQVVGDVDFEAAGERAAMITPVPGGVGPVTTAMLLANTVECARRQA